MKLEEIKALGLDEVEVRMQEIETEMHAEDADLEALSAEVDALNERRTAVKEEIETRKKLSEKVAQGAGTVIAEMEKKTMPSMEEVRASKEYADAYANYIKSNGLNDTEVRSLMSDLVEGGTIPTAKIVADKVAHSWESISLVARTPKINVKGLYSVPVEISHDSAVIHTEGGDAPAEENIEISEVLMTPVSLKKWASMTDVVYALHGNSFLEYLNAEIIQGIGETAAAQEVAAIKASPLTQTVTHALDEDAVNAGFAVLADEATNPVVIMRRATFFNTFLALRGTDGHAIYQATPENGKATYYLNGAEVIFSSQVGANEVIVGDLNGALINLPAGNEVDFTIDRTSKEARTNNKIFCVGSQLAAFGVVRKNFFAIVRAE